MWGLEVWVAILDFVVLDDDESGDGGEEGYVVQGGVGVGALFLLFGRVGWLEDEDALDEEEDGGGVEELGNISRNLPGGRGTYGMGREERQVMAEDAAPDDRCELDNVSACC